MFVSVLTLFVVLVGQQLIMTTLVYIVAEQSTYLHVVTNMLLDMMCYCAAIEGFGNQQRLYPLRCGFFFPNIERRKRERRKRGNDGREDTGRENNII